MRLSLVIAVSMLAGGCGQTGSLYLPDESVETPVEIRGPGEEPAADSAGDGKKPEKPTKPPGR
ncbi:MAG: LPS translocon maturation chaperone LptM [Steroidobacteraceae bacterium]